MTDVQRKDLDSARSVLSVLLGNLALVDGDEDLKKLKDFLVLTIPKVDSAAGIQLAGRGGVQDFKDNLKLEGSKIGKTWIGALKTVKAPLDMDLPKALKYSPSAYEKLDDNSWYQFNDEILIPKCNQYQPNVAKYGRTQAEVDTLKEYNDAFVLAMTKPEEVTNRLKKAKKVVDEGIDGMNKLGVATDPFAKAYRDLHPEFVADFEDARMKKGK